MIFLAWYWSVTMTNLFWMNFENGLKYCPPSVCQLQFLNFSIGLPHTTHPILLLVGPLNFHKYLPFICAICIPIYHILSVNLQDYRQ